MIIPGSLPLQSRKDALGGGRASSAVRSGAVQQELLPPSWGQTNSRCFLASVLPCSETLGVFRL